MKMFKMVIFSLFVMLMIFAAVNMICATSITINSTNSTLKNVVNKYDTIYLDDGVYKGVSNRNVNISKNTTIIGLNKGGTIIDAEKNGGLFDINKGYSLVLVNITFTNRISSIYNQGNLIISNVSFTESYSFDGIIRNSGILRIYDSSFNNNYNVLINSFTGNDIIRNCEFNNNQGNLDGIIIFKGKNRVVSLVNSTFSNNSAPTGLILIAGDYVNMNVSNCSFVNSKCNLFAITGVFAPSTGSKIEPSNIIEINTTINYNPNIFIVINLNKNGAMTFKTTLRDRYGMILPNQRLYFYVNGKLLGSTLTDKNGMAAFSIKRSNLNFSVKLIFNKFTEKTSVRTINYNRTSFMGSASKFVVGESKIVSKIKFTKKKDGLIYRKYYIYNNGDSFASKIFNKKISSKYKLVKYTYKNMIFKYNKSKKSISAKVNDLLPYKFNKKNLGVLILVYKKK